MLLDVAIQQAAQQLSICLCLSIAVPLPLADAQACVRAVSVCGETLTSETIASVNWRNNLTRTHSHTHTPTQIHSNTNARATHVHTRRHTDIGYS